MVLLLTIGTIVLAAAAVYLLLEKHELAELLETERAKVKATITYAEDLALTIERLRSELEAKDVELLSKNQQQARPGRPRKN